MLGRLRNSYAEVDLNALEQKFLSLKGLLKNCAMSPMVKADAYGHGDVQVARVCERLGARYLGVALIEEGIKLRLAGIQTPILAFCQFDSMGAEAIVKYRLTPVLSVFDQINKLKKMWFTKQRPTPFILNLTRECSVWDLNRKKLLESPKNFKENPI